jgi:hypothetical protein
MSTIETVATSKPARPRTKAKGMPKPAAFFGNITFMDLTNARKIRYIPQVELGIFTRRDGITRLSIAHMVDPELQTVDRRDIELPPDIAQALIEAITG